MIKKLFFTGLALTLMAAPIAVSAQSASVSAQTASQLQASLVTLEQQLNQALSQLGTTNTSTSNTTSTNMSTAGSTGTTGTTPTTSTLPDNESNYTGTTSGAGCPALTSTLSEGENDAQTGGQVTQLQEFLTAYFNLNPNLIVTGYFGATTESYVAQFQGENNLPQVGYVGSQTRAAIASICSAATNPTSGPSFTVSPSAGQAPLTVSFSASGSAVSASAMVDFGDGSTSTLAASGSAWSTSHTYKVAGTYTPKLEVPYTPANGIPGVKVIATATVIVGTSPVVNVQNLSASPSSGAAPLTVNFTTGSLPYTAGHDTYIFYFGDGASTTLSTQGGCTQAVGTSCTYSLSHTYTTSGTFEASVVDQCGPSGICNDIIAPQGEQALIVVSGGTNSSSISVSLGANSVPENGTLGLSWSSSGAPSNAGVVLQLFDQSGDDLGRITQDQQPTGSYTWTLPGDPCNSTGTLCPSPSDDPDVFATLPGNYTIVAQLYTPTGGLGGGLLASASNLTTVATSAAVPLTVTGPGSRGSTIEMTVPGSVQIAPGQTAAVNSSGTISPIFTFVSTTTVQGALAADISGVCSPNAPECDTWGLTLSLNVPQVFGSDQFTLTAITPTAATIAVTPSSALTFSIPSTVSFTAIYQQATDSTDGYVLGLNSVNENALTANVNWAQINGSGKNFTLTLNTSQTVTGGVTLLLSALSASGATINVTGGTVNPDYSVTATPASGSTPLAVSLSYSPSLQTFVNAYCEEAQGTNTYNVVVDWGDGAGPQNTPSSVCNPHTYTSGGTYTVHVSVYKGSGESNLIWTGSTQVVAAGSALTSCLLLTQNMAPGATDATTGGQVTQLQQFLAQDSTIYPSGLVTGYFGPGTTAAVQAYQTKEDIVSSGSPSTTGFGYVGPATRAQLAKHCPTFNASFSASPSSGAAPLMVTFNATGTPGTYTLAFGTIIGSASTTNLTIPVIECPSSSCTGTGSASVTYPAQGTYTATLMRLTCNGADPSTCSSPTNVTVGTATITVGAPNYLSAKPSSGQAPLSVTFTGTIPGKSYSLNFGDGSTPIGSEENVDCVQTDPNCASTATIAVNQTHIYTSAGTYTATLTDGSGNQVGSVNVKVSGAAGPGSCTAALPTHDLSLGETDSDVGGDVTLLQDFLIAQGDLPATDNTGFFGNATQAGVMTFQQANNVSPVSGFVGVITRGAMQAACNGTKPTTSGFSFSASPSSGNVPLSTTFTLTDAETLESGLIYVVDFGDGTRGTLNATASSISTLTTAPHTYSQAGTFNVNLLQERNLCAGLVTTPGCVADLQVATTTVTVSTPPAAPTCSLSFSPSTIAPGASATLTYATQNGTSLNIATVGASGASSGSTTVSPSVTTAYSATVTGPGGSGSCSATLTVSAPTPVTPPAPTTQTFNVGTDCNGSFCAADPGTANQDCVDRGFTSATNYVYYPVTQSNPNNGSIYTGNESWWTGSWHYYWGGQCNTGGGCTPQNPNEIQQITCQKGGSATTPSATAAAVVQAQQAQPYVDGGGSY